MKRLPIKPHVAVILLGVAIALFTMGSGIIPIFTQWHDDSDVAREVFRLSGRSPEDVARTTTEAYTAGKSLAPRPAHGALRLDKLRATGFEPEDAFTALARYCDSQRP